MQLAGKVVLVAGAQQGIGRAMEFAAAGADVAINWLDDKAAAQSPCRRQAEGTDALVWLMR
jgi:NAD(P)-dependent dehydrogenase (short-subunit alcohol dehydrogenase family)